MNKNKIPSEFKVECVAIEGELKTNAKFEFIDAEDKLAKTLNQLNETLKNLLKKKLNLSRDLIQILNLFYRLHCC